MASTLNSLSLFSLWDRCSEYLGDELSAQQFNTWIKPLSVAHGDCDALQAPSQTLVLLAPNRFIRDWVRDKFQLRLDEFARLFSDGHISSVKLEVAAQPAPSFMGGESLMSSAQSSLESAAPQSRRTGESHLVDSPVRRQHGFSAANGDAYESDLARKEGASPPPGQTPDTIDFGDPKLSFESNNQGFLSQTSSNPQQASDWSAKELAGHGANRSGNYDAGFEVVRESAHQNNILGRYRFDNFVEGKSNQLARAAAIQVVENPSGSYNPLFLYGGVGLGKTHLMHAVGNEIKRRNPSAKVVYLHSEQFVGDMVKALQLNAINDFKRYYRSVDALLIDDIQFFANKERSQEEFFHTFNALLEGGHQMIFSCDRYPKSISGVEERLKSRFGWGLTVQIEPPELETRVAILNRKAEQENIQIPNDAAFFMAQKVRANVRELEGALKRVNANAEFLKAPITIDLIKESLKDLLALQDKMVSIDNIQRTVAEYYKIKIADLHSKRRNRSVARPRQVAMALAKELTNHSLPEIGDAFGGRDHTTVLHACRKIKELRESTADLGEDYHNLIRLLST